MNTDKDIISCPMFKKLISPCIDNELDQNQKDSFLAHSSQCDLCKIEYEGQKHVVKMLGALPRITTSSEFDFELKTRLRMEEKRLRNPLYRFKLFVDDYTVPIAAAASLLFLVGAVYFSMLLINGADSTIATSAGFSPDENVASGNVRYEMDRTPDEIIYKYYVIDTVKPEDLESGVFLNSAGGGQGQAQTSQVANIISF